VKRGHVVVFLLLAATLLVGVLLLWQVSRDTKNVPGRYTTTWNGLAPPIPLRDAEGRAAERAGRWASDARLFKVQASWRPPADMLQVEKLPVAWSFYYYSANQAEVAVVTVNGDKVFWAPPIAITSSPSALSVFPPVHGAESAWVSFQAAGGEAFLREHADALVQYRLRRTDEGIHWTVFAFGGGDHFEVVVDAETGLVRSKPDTSEEN